MNPTPIAGRIVATALVVGAGLAGWQVAGAPADGAGTEPPACPAALAADVLRTGRPGVPDRLVPVPLPQPRGPIAVRICRYPASTAGTALAGSAALDPSRTAELAGVLNTPPAPVAAGPCTVAGPVTLLVFRYTQGPPLIAQVDGGPCASVSTSARVEQGRTDVVRMVDRFVG